MGVRYSALTALAVGALALGTGCLSPGKKTESKKPDVTQPGVLPPPQETTRAGGDVSAATNGANGPVVPASATTPAGGLPAPFAVPPGASGASLSKLTTKMERKVTATDFAVGWQPRVAYLPDPVKNGRMSPGIAGQMFLYGGPKLEFAQADGVLTVDLVDDSPRPAGQPAATPERWQFDKNTLRNLQTRDETFGKSYALFLPWPTYKSDITRVRISARYDPETGPPLFATPSTITLDSTPFGAPVWSEGAKDKTGGAPFISARPGTPSAQPGAPIPLGGGTQPGAPISLGGGAAPMIPIHSPPGPALPIPGAAAPIPIPNGPAPMFPLQNGPIPIRPEGASVPPTGFMPVAPAAPAGTGPVTAGPYSAVPGDVPQLAITLPGPK